jgi:uncharacterized membrane protein YqgA involved in biofilm formation
MSGLLGPSVNAIAIVVCGLVGCFLMRGIPARFEEIFRKAIGLSVVLIGIKGALDCQRMLLCIMSMVIGSALGELIGIDAFMNRIGQWAERRFVKNSGGEGHSFAKAFVSTTILYCGGSMATVGSLQSGLLGNNEILFAKSILDGTTSIVFSATMGIGVVFSAIPVFIYQAGIAMASILVKDLLTPDIIREMSAVGNLIVAGIGFNFLEIKEIKVANFIPAIFIPVVYMIIEGRILHFF